jgi:hypothetical protein
MSTQEQRTATADRWLIDGASRRDDAATGPSKPSQWLTGPGRPAKATGARRKARSGNRPASAPRSEVAAQRERRLAAKLKQAEERIDAQAVALEEVTERLEKLEARLARLRRKRPSSRTATSGRSS